jgi:hypothetical protein
MRPFRHAVMSAAASRFARDRAQHSEAAGIDQRYSPNLVEKLSEKGYEQRSEPVFGRIREPKRSEEPLLGGPEGYAVGASETFRTVSEKEFSEVRRK